MDSVSRPRKRCKKQSKKHAGKPKEKEQAEELIPETRLSTLQQVGVALGIAKEKISEEVLRASPAKKSPEQCPNGDD
jgi:hypothetical protein